VRKEPTRDARDLLNAMAQALQDREPILSAEQYLDLLKKLWPTLQLDEVNRTFADRFKLGTFAFVLTMPQRPEVALPANDQVLAAGRAALARKVEPPLAQTRPTVLLEQLPRPGKLIDLETDEELGITSGWLENGVRVHHRFMDYRKDAVLVSFTLAGGQIEETAENAGVTTVAALVFDQPATNRLTSTDIQDIMTGKNIDLRPSAQDDAFTLMLSGSPLDLEAGLQLAHALLTDGKLERSAFDHWKKETLERYDTASRMPEYVAFDTLLRTVSGDDPRRIVLLPPKLVEAQTLDRGQAWFGRLCRETALEVAVVGEITLEQVRPLLEQYAGSLPKRPRTAAYLDKLRVLQRPPGPLTANIEVPTITPQAMAVTGFIGCDATAMRDVRALNLAASILDSRLILRVREDLGLVYAFQAVNGPARTYVDAGLFFSGAPCAPDKVDEVLREVGAILQTFAEKGPTPAELDNAKKQVRNHLDTQLKDPQYWFGQLATLNLHKTSLADLKRIPEAYEALTAEQVQSVFTKYYQPARAFNVTAVPAKVPTTQPSQ